MRHIGVLFEGDINRQLGVFNAVISRVKHLQQAGDYKINVVMLQVYDGWLMRQIRRSKRIESRPSEIVADGVTVRVSWFRRRMSDAIMHRLFHKPPRALMKHLQQLGWEMRGNDLVSAHDRIMGHAAVFAGKQLEIPSFITWHGASIYTDPPRDQMIKQQTIKLLHSATCNFFVSQGLLDKAHAELTDGFPAEVLLNGAGPQFQRFDDSRRAQLRQRYGIAPEKQVVAFVGRFEPVKNVTMLPEIFQEMERKFGKSLTFWAIGDGIQLDETRRQMDKRGINCHFTGKVPPEEIPNLLNCVDLLVLPSSLEGLPLVVIEALSCGARVVATNVIGTAEAVGRENAIDLGDNFIDRITTRGVELLQGGIEQKLPNEVSWSATAVKEDRIYQQYLAQK